jgi:AcrR family transcriptional regulator
VYAYFPGKDALFDAAVTSDAEALIAEADQAASGAVLRARWLALAGAVVDGMDRHPLARRVLAGEEPGVAARLLDIEPLRALTARMATDLAEGQAAGLVRADVDASAMAAGLETILLALVMAQLQTGLDGDEVRRAGIFSVLDAALRPAQAAQTV